MRSKIIPEVHEPLLLKDRHLMKFLSRIAPIEGDEMCWEWKGQFMTSGYGTFCYLGQRYTAHRFAWSLFRGTLTQGLLLDHKCMNRKCVNPFHLREVTSAVNNLENSRGVAALNAVKTHCPKGHAYEGDNLRIRKRPNGRQQRTCVICMRGYRSKSAEARNKNM